MLDPVFEGQLRKEKEGGPLNAEMNVGARSTLAIDTRMAALHNIGLVILCTKSTCHMTVLLP